MRSLLAALLLLTAVGCDTTEPDTGDPTPDYVGTLVEYRVSVVGTAAKTNVSYTDADGVTQTENVDFSRDAFYTQSFELPARATPTLSITGRGLIDSGRLSTRITVTRLDTGDEVITDSDSEVTTTTGEMLMVTSTVDVPQVIVLPDEEAQQ